MRWDFFNFNKPKANAKKERYAKRHRTSGVRCELGNVVDISDSGMRLAVSGNCPVKLGDVLALTIREVAHKAEVRGCVVWVRKEGGQTLCGIAFLDVRPGTKAAIEQIAGVGEALNNNASSGAKPVVTKAGEQQPSVANPTKPADAKAIPGDNSKAGSTNNAKAVVSIEIEDLYAIFDLPNAATEEEITKAFRSMARNLHPDRNKAPDAAERFSAVSKAYKVLRDAELRKRYDDLRSRAA